MADSSTNLHLTINGDVKVTIGQAGATEDAEEAVSLAPRADTAQRKRQGQLAELIFRTALHLAAATASSGAAVEMLKVLGLD
jgi:hypothetical protein